jgi:hypothetical protein
VLQAVVARLPDAKAIAAARDAQQQPQQQQAAADSWRSFAMSVSSGSAVGPEAFRQQLRTQAWSFYSLLLELGLMMVAQRGSACKAVQLKALWWGPGL